jgi:hypothetical protein
MKQCNAEEGVLFIHLLIERGIELINKSKGGK